MQDTLFESASVESTPSGVFSVLSVALRWIGAIVSVGLVAGIVYWAFLLGQRDATELPVIRAMEGEARVLPEDPGGAQADNQGLAVNEVLAETAPQVIETDAALAPQPESLAEEDQSLGALEATMREAAAQLLTDAEPMRVQASSRLVEIPTSGASATAGEDDPSVTATGIVTVPVRRPASFYESDIINNLVLEVIPEEGDTSLEVPALETPAPLYGNPLLDPGAALAQLGVFNSLADAEEAWGRFQRQHADLLGGLKRYIEPVETSGRVLYRLRAAGLGDLDQTRALCAALEGRGQECISVTLQ